LLEANIFWFFLLLLKHLQDVLLMDTIAVLGMVLEDAHHVQNIKRQVDMVAVEGKPQGGGLAVPDRALFTHFLFFYKIL